MAELSPTLGIFEPAAAEEIESTFSGNILVYTRTGHILNHVIVRSTSQLQHVYANT